ncbi:pectinesterase family protein [Formosa sp. S-31]|uniref:pectinesterase family protein n=1 Tax=Formosa sp. S-31 TaxID=2790949 RepID=UPI003EB6D528
MKKIAMLLIVMYSGLSQVLTAQSYPEAGTFYSYNFKDGSVLPQDTSFRYDTVESTDGYLTLNSGTGQQFWFHSSGHGIYIYNDNYFELDVAGDADITFLTCAYAPADGQFTITDTSNTVLGVISGTNNGNSGEGTSVYSYEGEATTLTVTYSSTSGSGYAYLHGVTIDNILEVSAEPGTTYDFDFTDGSVVPTDSSINYNQIASNDGILNIKSGSGGTFRFNDTTHGLSLKDGNLFEMVVAGNAVFSFSVCEYSASDAILTFKDESGTEIGNIPAYSANDGEIMTYEYTGDAGTITVTLSASSAIYMHNLSIENESDSIVTAESGETYTYNFTDGSVVPTDNSINYDQINSEDQILYLKKGTGNTFKFNDTTHGLSLKNGNYFELVVTDNAIISFTVCAYSSTDAILSFTDENGLEIGDLPAYSSTDGEIINFIYSGSPGTVTATLTAGGSIYMHQVSIANSAISNGLIDVWDFGAEQLDSNSYNNQLSETIINSWYDGISEVTTQVNLPSFTAGALSFTTGSSDRLRTTNTNLTRWDNELGNSDAFTGRLYINNNSGSSYFNLNLNEDDEVTIWALSQYATGKLKFEYQSDTSIQNDEADLSDSVSQLDFVASTPGTYKIYDSQDKPSFYRIQVKPAEYTTISGTIDLTEAANISSDYQIAFTNSFGKSWVTTNASGTYNVSVPLGYTYDINLLDANGFIITNETSITTSETSQEKDLIIQGINLNILSGTILGLDTDISSLNLIFTPESETAYFPIAEINLEENTYTVQLEPSLNYTISTEGVNDYNLDTNLINLSEDTALDISFTLKPLWNVSLNLTGIDLNTYTDLTYSFTNINEPDYTYTFTDPSNIQLRDGTYQVHVNGLELTPIELEETPDLTVSASDTNITLNFVPVKTWTFGTDEILEGSTSYRGLLFTGSLYNQLPKIHLLAQTGSTISVPISPGEKLNVSYYYAADFYFNDEITHITTNSGSTSTEEIATFIYTGTTEGTVDINIDATTYFTQITVEPYIPLTTELTVGTDKDFQTINEALDMVATMARTENERITILIDPGNYEEMLVINLPNITLKNASPTPSTNLTNKGVDIDPNAVRITSYYGHGYNYYSQDENNKWSSTALANSKLNGSASNINDGAGTTDGSFWNATVVISGDGFIAEHIIIENSFNQYISQKESEDILELADGNKGIRPTEVGNTEVQDRSFVERAAAIAITNNTDKVILNQCRIVGRQDTFYGGRNARVVIYKGAVMGAVDYIFGGMTAVFYKTNLIMNTSDNSSDRTYFTAAQQSSGMRGYLMYECLVKSTIPGEETASENSSKPGFFGRPWAAETSEVVFYNTTVETSGFPGYEGLSLIDPEGWKNSLGGESEFMYEYGTIENSGIDNSSSRASWSTILSEPVLFDGTAITPLNFTKGDDNWDPLTALMTDTTPPTITLIGDNPQIIELGSEYTELGATAVDVVDGDISEAITIDSSNFNPYAIGDYLVTYNVSDAAGNIAVTVERTVTVQYTPDIPDLADSSDTGVSNTDNITNIKSPTLIGNVSALNAGKTIEIVSNELVIGTGIAEIDGTYEIPITEELSDGVYNLSVHLLSEDTTTENSLPLEIHIETISPIITLLGENPLNLYEGEIYSEPGVTASDLPDTDLTAQIVINKETLNTDILGTYSITYNVVDIAGNIAQEVTRTVNVIPVPDTNIPVITLLGETSMDIYQYENFQDPGATAADDTDGDITDLIAIAGDIVDSNILGTYVITYNVSDSANNRAQEMTRTVNVIPVPDTTIPVIILLGETSMDIYQYENFQDPGATAADDTDGDITDLIAIAGDIVDSNILGTYVITYNVSDSANNPAQEMTRTVNVIPVPDTTIPVITLLGETSMDIYQFENFQDPGATASDDTDGDITDLIAIAGDIVDSNILGTYVITYNVSDSANNPAQEVTRTVNVIPVPDQIIPVITLLGETTMDIYQFENFQDPGATASDDTDGDITELIAIAGDIVDSNILGTYVITYNVSDNANNPAQEVTRTVNVIPVPPTLEIKDIVLIGATNNETLGTITDNKIFSTQDLPEDMRLSVEVSTTTDVESVRMVLSGAKSKLRNESYLPYTLYGYKSLGYSSSKFYTGEYTLTITTYSENNQSGISGPPVTLSFKIIEGAVPLDLDEDGFTDDIDCDDSNPLIFPGANELCDGIDNNCNGEIDEGFTKTIYYVDNDNDGFGDPKSGTLLCEPVTGYVLDYTDCNDSNPEIYPNAIEICDGIDNNCDGIIDEGFTKTMYYADNDRDGFGDPENETLLCEPVIGYVLNHTDCDDNNPEIYPGAIEICDGIDNNCDGIIDEGFTKTIYYADNDKDGFGDPESGILLCEPVTGYVLDNTDCNDNNASINPNASEICDGIDNNCDGLIDSEDSNSNCESQFTVLNANLIDAENQLSLGPLYNGRVISTTELPSTMKLSIEVFVTSDVESTRMVLAGAKSKLRNENSPPYTLYGYKNGRYSSSQFYIGNYTLTIYTFSQNNQEGTQGTPKTISFQIVDNDLVNIDNDNDGYSADEDCDDLNALIYPGAEEICDGLDNNCDGQIDEGYTPSIFYADLDGDGYGDLFAATELCSPTNGYVSNALDCNDQNNSIHPEAQEICDGIDNNCNGIIDEGFEKSTYFADNDGDGFGDPESAVDLCVPWTGYVSNSLDCDDSNASVHPNAIEICDGIDNNCDGLIDAEDSNSDCSGKLNILSLELIDTKNNSSLGSLTDGLQIDINTLPNLYLSVQAFTTEDVESVRFEMSGSKSKLRNESHLPYTLYGYKNNGYSGSKFRLGTYYLTVTPYSQNNQSGISGTPYIITFEIIDTQTTTSRVIPEDNYEAPLKTETISEFEFSPNPFKTYINMDLPSSYHNAPVEVHIFDLNGRSVYYKRFPGTTQELHIDNLNKLEMGPYIFRIQNLLSGELINKQLIKF